MTSVQDVRSATSCAGTHSSGWPKDAAAAASPWSPAAPRNSSAHIEPGACLTRPGCSRRGSPCPTWVARTVRGQLQPACAAGEQLHAQERLERPHLPTHGLTAAGVTSNSCAAFDTLRCRPAAPKAFNGFIGGRGCMWPGRVDSDVWFNGLSVGAGGQGRAIRLGRY
jgi:hypothetical protein